MALPGQIILSSEVDIRSVGAQIAGNMNYSQRLQLFHYLAQLAAADGEFSASEKAVLESIAVSIGISAEDMNSVIAMFYKDTRSAYDVLEISPDASDAEVKAAYRRMAMKNHPDKVASPARHSTKRDRAGSARTSGRDLTSMWRTPRSSSCRTSPPRC